MTTSAECECDRGFYSQNAEHELGCPFGAILPQLGDRPVFGVHRLPVAEAAAAPAWKPETEADREARFEREQAAFAKQLRKEAVELLGHRP